MNKYCLFLVYVVVPAEPWWRRPSLFYTFTRGVCSASTYVSFIFLIIYILITFHAEAIYPTHVDLDQHTQTSK